MKLSLAIVASALVTIVAAMPTPEKELNCPPNYAKYAKSPEGFHK